MVEDKVFTSADTLGPDSGLYVVKSAQKTVPQLLILGRQLWTLIWKHLRKQPET